MDKDWYQVSGTFSVSLRADDGEAAEKAVFDQFGEILGPETVIQTLQMDIVPGSAAKIDTDF